MKNKIFGILLGIIASFSFINSVFAEDFSIVVDATSSPSVVTIGNEVVITLNLTANRSVDHCQFRVEADDSLTYKEMNTANSWNLDEGAINNFILENNGTSSTSDKVNILQIKYIVNGDGNVTIHTDGCSGVASVEDSYEATYKDIVVSVKAKELSEDTSLKSLKVTGGNLENSFDSQNTGDYIVNLTSSKFGLELEASNPDFQDDIVVKNNDTVINDYSNIIFNDASGQGQMPITITVNGKTTYRLLILYEEEVLDNSLKYIKINGKELFLVSGKYSYEFIVDSSITSFNDEAELNDNNNFKFDKDTGNAPAMFSINDVVDVEIVIVPKSEQISADKATYKITVIKDNNKDQSENDDNSTDTGDTGNNGSSNTGDNNNSSNNNDDDKNTGTNPETGDVSMYVMAIILVVSLFGSVFLYQKNLEGYK